MSKTNDFNVEVTNRIIELMEMSKGTNRPFLSWKKNGTSMTLPVNISTNKAYSGVNVLILMHSMLAGGYKTNHWVTMKQANFMGYKVIKGASATQIAMYKPYVKKDKETDEDKVITFLKTFNVFNVEQLEGYEVDESQNQAVSTEDDNLQAERYLSIANVTYGDDRACYSPSHDRIFMPSKSQFHEMHSFYAVGLHELTHWTAHESRLSRSIGYSSKGSEEYAYEELVAEIGSAFLCADIGIIQHTQEDHAQYLNSWISVLKNDPTMIFKAAKDAQKAFSFITEQAERLVVEELPMAS